MPIRPHLNRFLKTFEREFDTHNVIEVSRSALRHNLAYFAKSSGLQVAPVLKGNAYGHGIEIVAEAYRGLELPFIAVDGYFEALRVRNVGRWPVLVMGAIAPQNFARLRYNDFAFVVQDEATIEALAKTNKSVAIHLECNTGMNRYGAKRDEFASLVKAAMRFPNLQIEGIMTHLADSDGDSPTTVSDAAAEFDGCVEIALERGVTPKFIHIAQSAGSVRARSKYANLIRVGIGGYGINPFPKGHEHYPGMKANLRPALTLKSTITKINALSAGDKVSYNYTYTAPKAMKMGVLPLGYYEGVNRALSNQGSVLIEGKSVPIIGRVCMNHTMINLDGTDAKVGDEVVVYSNNPTDANSIQAIADQFGLFNYNLLTALSPDVRRKLVD